MIVVGCQHERLHPVDLRERVQHDLRAIVPREAVGDRSPTAHAGALFDIDARFADVEPLGAVVAHLDALAARV